MEQDYILVLGTNTCIYIFPQFPMAFQETLCRGLKGVVLTKRMTDHAETYRYMYHVQKVCGKITLT